MKTKNILLTMLIAAFAFGKTKAQDSLAKHTVHIAPSIGFNSTLKAPVFGGEVGYEYRLNKKWGFTAGVNIAYAQKNNPNIFDAGNTAVPQARNQRLLQNAIYAGAKYYFGRLYLSAELGYQDAYSTINFPYQGTGSSYNYGTNGFSGFYQAYGFGYQIPLKKGDNVEFFAKGSNGNNYTSFNAGFRYNFGLFSIKQNSVRR